MSISASYVLTILFSMVMHFVVPFQILTPRRRSEFSTTEIDDALIAKAANIGLIKIPKSGYKSPAATGTPLAL